MKLDINGINQLKKKIADCDLKLKEAIAKKGENTKSNTFGYENATLAIMALQKEIKDYHDILMNAKLVKPHNNENMVDLGDIVTLHDNDFGDEFKIQLNGNFYNPTDEKDGIEYTSVNSPLGEAVFGAKKGSNVTYSVGSNYFTMTIQDIKKELTKEM